jgi:hypothetical protein
MEWVKPLFYYGIVELLPITYHGMVKPFANYMILRIIKMVKLFADYISYGIVKPLVLLWNSQASAHYVYHGMVKPFC